LEVKNELFVIFQLLLFLGYQDSVGADFTDGKENGDFSLVKTKANGEISLVDQNGNTPLHFAASVEEAKFLLSEGGNINAKNAQDCSPLQVAIFCSKIMQV